jgi:histidinol-phosphate aminotransferase
VRPMASYQLPEWIRISIGTPKQNQRCLEALKTVLAQVPGSAGVPPA